jgi:hypothetical protein
MGVIAKLDKCRVFSLSFVLAINQRNNNCSFCISYHFLSRFGIFVDKLSITSFATSCKKQTMLVETASIFEIELNFEQNACLSVKDGPRESKAKVAIYSIMCDSNPSEKQISVEIAITHFFAEVISSLFQLLLPLLLLLLSLLSHLSLQLYVLHPFLSRNMSIDGQFSRCVCF